MEGKEKEETSSPAIGIDLGTTFSSAAIYQNGQLEIIPNLDGKRKTLSAVYYDPNQFSEVIIGDIAFTVSISCKRNYLCDMKRILGRSNDDVYVNNFIKKEKAKTMGLLFGIDENNCPCVKLHSTKKVKHNVTAENVSTEILRYKKKSAERYLGYKVREAVISVPAYFSNAQLAATKRAAEEAGFKVLKLITEPVAAAIYYTHGKIEKDTRLLMVDLGGGTLDVTIIKCTKDKFHVESIEGDIFLGGRDFDEVIFEYFKDEIRKKHGDVFLNPTNKRGERFLHRLLKIAMRFKHTLSIGMEHTEIIEIPNEEDYVVSLTRARFERLSEHLFQRIINTVERCLMDMSVDDIDKVVLVGGSSRMPKIHELLSTMFKENKIYTDLNPDEAVALGASIHAALLQNNIEQLERYQVKDVAPHSLGILAKYDLMVMFIQKGTPLPVCVKHVMETSENDQYSVIFNIYEGERKHCLHNKYLGDFVISKLPPGKAGQVEFEVTFLLDNDGLLRVSATESKTHSFNQLERKIDQLLVCDKMIPSLEYESLIEEEDKRYEDFYKLRLSVDTYCNGILYDVDLPSFKSKKDLLVRELDKFNKICKTLTPNDFKTLQTQFEKLQLRIDSSLSMKPRQ